MPSPQTEPVLSSKAVDMLIEAVSREPVSIVSYDHTELIDCSFRTTQVLYPETDVYNDTFSGGVIPARPGLTRGINGDFSVDDIYMGNRDNTRFSECLSNRIHEITQQKAEAILSFLLARSKEWIGGKDIGDAVRQIIQHESQIKIDNRFGNLHLPLDPQLLLRLDCPSSERTGMTGLLGASKNSYSLFGRNTCVVTDSTFYLISTEVFGKPEQSTFMIAMPEPRLTLPSSGFMRMLNPLNCFQSGERLQPLVCIKGKDAGSIHFMMEQTCSEQHSKVTGLG